LAKDSADVEEAQELIDAFVEDAHEVYAQREEELGESNTREFERQVWLTVLDRKWREHLYEMDYLREGIGLRAMAQRDPLVEYQREGAMMFDSMQQAFKEDVVGFLFNAQVSVRQPRAEQLLMGPDDTPTDIGATTGKTAPPVLRPAAEKSASTPQPGASQASPRSGSSRKSRAARSAASATRSTTPPPVLRKPTALDEVVAQKARPLSYSGPGDAKRTDESSGDRFKDVGRNAMCPCGSGRKFKNCHGRNAVG